MDEELELELELEQDYSEIRFFLSLLEDRYPMEFVADVAMAMAEEFNLAFCCLDCGNNTIEMEEYYMVSDAVWLSAVPDDDGMLCFDCLGSRINRPVTKKDLTDAPINLTHFESDKLPN